MSLTFPNLYLVLCKFRDTEQVEDTIILPCQNYIGYVRGVRLVISLNCCLEYARLLRSGCGSAIRSSFKLAISL